MEIRREVIEETYTATKEAKEGQIQSLRDAGSGTLVDQKNTLEAQLNRIQKDYDESLIRIRSAAEKFRDVKQNEINNVTGRLYHCIKKLSTNVC